MLTVLRLLWRRLHIVLTLACVLAAAVGLQFFFWAFRACPLRFDEGLLLRYRMRTEVCLDESRPEAVEVDERAIDCYCINSQNDVAILAPGLDGQDRLGLLRFAEDGSAVPYDGQRLDAELSHAIGFFDFNLLPLPRDGSQSWAVELRYGFLPPGQQTVHGRVRRVRNGIDPVFELRLETVEWVQAEPREHFRSLTDFVCRYRYDASRGIVDWASIRCRYGREGRQSPQFARIEVQLELDATSREEQVLALRDLALATADLQSSAPRNLDERLLIERLAAAADRHPRLQQLARRLLDGAADRAPAACYLQVASVKARRRPQAQQAAAALRARGYQAALRERDGRVTIVVGPYPEQRASIRRELAAVVGQDVFWLPAGQ